MNCLDVALCRLAHPQDSLLLGGQHASIPGTPTGGFLGSALACDIVRKKG